MQTESIILIRKPEPWQKELLRFDEATGTLVQTADSGEDFPEHAHVYILSSIEEATCTTDGRKIYTCSCGDSYSERIAATGHEWKNEGPVRMD